MTDRNREMKDTLKNDGYSNEEKYFYDLNRELIRLKKPNRDEKDSHPQKMSADELKEKSLKSEGSGE